MRRGGARLGLPAPTGDPAIGWIVLGASVPVLVGGLALTLDNRHTSVSQNLVDPSETPQPAAALVFPASARLDEASAALARTKPAVELPIMTLRF